MGLGGGHKQENRKELGIVVPLKFLEEYLKVASKLSVLEGSEVKECEDRKKPSDFASRQLLMSFRKREGGV